MPEANVKAINPEAATPETQVTLGTSKARHPTVDPDAPKATHKYREPQFRTLKRVLGDQVLDIFPSEFIDSVEAGYKFWQEHPRSYIDTVFASEQERDDVLAIMRAYAEAANEQGYTIATLADPDPRKLVWRAQTRRKWNRDED